METAARLSRHGTLVSVGGQGGPRGRAHRFWHAHQLSLACSRTPNCRFTLQSVLQLSRLPNTRSGSRRSYRTLHGAVRWDSFDFPAMPRSPTSQLPIFREGRFSRVCLDLSILSSPALSPGFYSNDHSVCYKFNFPLSDQKM